MMSLKKDLKQTLTKNTSKNHTLSDSDSDVTIEPDPPDWETAILGGDIASSSGQNYHSKVKSDQQTHNRTKNLPSKGKPSKRLSKTHDLSDSEDDLPKHGNTSHNKIDSDKDISNSKQFNYNKIHKPSDSKGDLKLKGTRISHTESDDETADIFKPRIKISPKQISKKQENLEYSKPKDSQKLSPFPQSLKRKQTLLLDEDENDLHILSIKKPVCKFGSNCYRKNPSHLREFFHPSE